jgi:hypothetical protein
MPDQNGESAPSTVEPELVVDHPAPAFLIQRKGRVWYVALIVLVVVSFVTCAGFVAYLAVIRDAIPVTRAILLVLVILAGGCCFALFLHNLEAVDGRLEISSHWGGLGGGLGGWRVSKSVTYLFAATGLVALLTTIASRQADNPKSYLTERYRSTIQKAQNVGVKNLSFKLVGGRLVLTGTTDQAKANEVWEQIKLANPTYDDIEVDFKIENAAATIK